MKALVIRSTGKYYTVEDDTGKQYECTVKGKFRLHGLKLTNPIAVGDWVNIDTRDLVINEILQRENYIIRQSPKKKHAQQIIASNIDQALLLATLAYPRTSTGFMDRFLITAETYHIPTIILFNKTDILSEEERSSVKKIKEIYEKAGYECRLISLLKKEGLDQLKEKLKDKTSLLCGHSGVGKSTFINIFVPDQDLATKEVSEYSRKGQHATTFAEMFDLPFGGKIIDTPGIKEFGVLDFEAEEVSHYYPEMRKFLNDCKFHNCLHINEPGCAIREAVDQGAISSERYQNYLRIVDNVKNAAKHWE